ncbi:MAG: signal peptidase I [Dermatophilaceae bacterium]|nr:signal peptidase I [Intrasporangiaceae bacterium]
MTDTPPRAPSAGSAVGDQPPERERRGFVRSVSDLVRETVIIVVMAMVLSFVVKTWVAQAFFIPSGSMEQTLQVGDRVMVSKLHKQFDGINRGDIVVFQDPGGWLPPSAARPAPTELSESVQRVLTFVGLLPDPADEHLIKRVIGVGGDRVVCCDPDERLSVNGAPIDEAYVYPSDAPSTIRFDITVPADSVWVMGDHRSDSQDSRYHPLDGDGTEGSVPLDLVVGRGVVTVWPLTRAGTMSNHPDVFAGIPAP